MTETTLALCKTPVLGILMWLSSMCISNQALEDAQVDLSKQGTILTQEIDIPMDEPYTLELHFTFPDRDSYENSEVAGEPSASKELCNTVTPDAILLPEEKKAIGAKISVKVDILTEDGNLLNSYYYSSRCLNSWGHLTKSRRFGSLNLNKGNYKIVITNINPIPLNHNEKAKFVFYGRGAGFP